MPSQSRCAGIELRRVQFPVCVFQDPGKQAQEVVSRPLRPERLPEVAMGRIQEGLGSGRCSYGAVLRSVLLALEEPRNS